MAQTEQQRSFARRTRALPGLLVHLHPAVLLGAGAAIVVLGVLIVTRPLSSLVLLGVYVGISCIISGVADLLGRGATPTRWRVGFAVLWIVAGLAVIVWLGRSIELLPPSLAILLLVSGLGRLAGLFQGPVSGRVLAGSFGAAEMAFGILALAWPDVTLIVVAVLFGVRTVVFGGSLLLRGGRSLFGKKDVSAEGSLRPAPASTAGALVAGLRWTAAVVVLALTAGIFTVSHALRDGAPVVDAFYAAPAAIPSGPGVLLRSSPYTTGLPSGVSAWRILYTTATGNGAPALASGVVAVPRATGPGPRPVIAWNHGTNGIAQGCAPSLTPNAISPEAIPALDAVVRNGWVVVATDYTGEGTEGVFPYLVGATEARSSLDAVRAAHQLPSLNLSDRTAIWGHSQGGHATLWAAQIAPSYAPELKIVGAAALSPASNPLALAADITAKGSAGPIAVVTSFLLSSYVRSYNDVQLGDYVATSAHTLVQEMAARCATEPGALVSVLNSMAVSQDQPLFKLNLTTGPLAERLTENIPTGPFTQPLFIGQGDSDEVIAPAIQDDYVTGLCAAGQPLEYKTYPGKSHMGVVAPDSPLNADLEEWTRDRLNGASAEDTCPH